MSQGVKQVLWIPAENERPQARLMVCAHMGGRGHRGKISALHVLQPCCVWDSMEAGVGGFARQCLHCVNIKVEELKQRPLGELIHGDRVGEMTHFD